MSLCVPLYAEHVAEALRLDENLKSLRAQLVPAFPKLWRIPPMILKKWEVKIKEAERDEAKEGKEGGSERSALQAEEGEEEEEDEDEYEETDEEGDEDEDDEDNSGEGEDQVGEDRKDKPSVKQRPLPRSSTSTPATATATSSPAFAWRDTLSGDKRDLLDEFIGMHGKKP